MMCTHSITAFFNSAPIAIVSVLYSMRDFQAKRAHILPPTFSQGNRNMHEVKLPACLFANARNCRSVLLFSKSNKMFFGYFDPETIFLDSKNKQFSGWPNRYFGLKRSTTADVLAVLTASIIMVYSVRSLFQFTLSKNQNITFSCMLWLASKNAADNVSATNPVHLLSFNLENRQTERVDVRSIRRLQQQEFVASRLLNLR